MDTPSNTAAWQPEPGVPLDVRSAPYTAPGEHEIVVRNAAVAINPIDWKLQDAALFDWLAYPLILGSDVAGEVVEVGSGVSRFRVGDRVLGQATGTTEGRPAGGAFQQHTVVAAHMAALIPDDLSYASAAVLPLGLGTAACGLFETDQLALQHPSLNPSPTGQALLVWGGASSVGCNAVQLAVAAGYEVIATASPSHTEWLEGLGASRVLDYKSATVVDDLVAAFEGKTLAGAFHAAGDLDACWHVVDRCAGAKVVSTTQPRLEHPAGDVQVRAIFGDSLKDNEVSRAVYVAFLGDALAAGRYVCAPEPVVVGAGLAALQAGLDAQRKGVSAQKIVVTLD